MASSRSARPAPRSWLDPRHAALVWLFLSLLLQGSSCPQEELDEEPADFSEAILFETNPVIVAEGSAVSVGLDFRSRRPDLFFGGYEAVRPPDELRLDFREERRTSATPYLADLEIRPRAGSAGIHRVVVEAGQSGDEIERALSVIVLPRAVVDLPGAVAIDGGGFHTLAILGDGQVWAWGRNVEGQLGDGTRIDRVAPVAVRGLPGPARAVAAGRLHSLALLEDGTVWAWGHNDFRKLGAASRLDEILEVVQPEPVTCRDFRCDAGLPRFIAIAAGGDHSLALTEDGVVWAWGSYGRGQLGRESNGRREGIAFPIGFPNDLSGVVRFVAIAAGDEFSLALEDDGRVWGWGDNRLGQLGDGFERQYAFPVEIFGLGPGAATAIAAGSDHTLVLTPDGTVLSAGSNSFGQLGVAERALDGFFPVPQQRDVVAIAAGFAHSIALRADGTAYSWGSNAFDQLGFPERTPPSFEPNPSLVQGVPLLRAIAGGGRHSLGLSRDCPQLWGWGDNGSGQLGIGNAGRNGYAGRTLAVGDREPGTDAGDCGLPLSVAISGEGGVTSDTGQIDCPDELCSEIYDRDTRVGLTAVAAEGQRFVGWAGDLEATTPDVDIVVADSRNVVARFETVRRPPVADFVFTPESPERRELVRFDASPSTDPDGRIVAYAWSSPDDLFFEGSGAIYETSFSFTGEYDIELTVTDDQGLSSTRVRRIVVVPASPGGGDGGGGGGDGPGDPPTSYSLEIVFVGTGSGRVSLLGGEIECTGTCSLRLGAGQSFSIEAFADEGSFFSHFEGCDALPGTPSSVCPVALDANRSVTVFFE